MRDIRDSFGRKIVDFFGLGRQISVQLDRNTYFIQERYVVVDTELTGLDGKRDSIVSIGAVRMMGGRIALGDTFYSLVKPNTQLTSDSIVIHGIRPADVVEEADIETILSAFAEFCGQDIIVGHCVSIDLEFLNREMKKSFGAPMSNAVIDTLSLFYWLKRRLSSHRAFALPLDGYSLSETAKRFGVRAQGEHNALMDAFVTAQLFQRFLPLLSDAGIRNTVDLLKLGDPGKGGDVHDFSM